MILKYKEFRYKLIFQGSKDSYFVWLNPELELDIRSRRLECFPVSVRDIRHFEKTGEWIIE